MAWEEKGGNSSDSLREPIHTVKQGPEANLKCRRGNRELFWPEAARWSRVEGGADPPRRVWGAECPLRPNDPDFDLPTGQQRYDDELQVWRGRGYALARADVILPSYLPSHVPRCCREPLASTTVPGLTRSRRLRASRPPSTQQSSTHTSTAPLSRRCGPRHGRTWTSWSSRTCTRSVYPRQRWRGWRGPTSTSPPSLFCSKSLAACSCTVPCLVGFKLKTTTSSKHYLYKPEDSTLSWQ